MNAIIGCIKNLWLGAEAIYLFGSGASGSFRSDSDVDIAVLAPAKPDAEAILSLKGQISQITQRDVDLVDLRRADTVTAAQVIHSGQLLFCNEPTKVGLYETMVFSSYALLNEERKEIIEQIQRQGSVYG